MNWKCLNKKYILENKWLRIRKDKVLLPNNTIITDYYVIEKNDVVLIIPVSDDGKILLKTEYRYPVNQTLIEIPGGTIENVSEEPLTTAKRELLEETGYISEIWKPLGILYDYPTKDTNKISVFVAEKIKYLNLQKLDITESISYKFYSPIEIKTMILENKICVSGSVAALLRYFLLTMTE